MKNSLEKSVEEYKSALHKIGIKKEAIEREKLEINKLADEKSRLRTYITYSQMMGKRIQNPIIDYCFRNFNKNIYESLELVNEFMEQVKYYTGQKILAVREKEKLEMGIISGECEFEVEKSFRHLYVPVDNSKVLWVNTSSKTDWEKGENKIWINDDVFDTKNIKFKEMNPQKSEFLKKFPELLKEQINNYKKSKEFGGYWFADYSQDVHIGGSGPKNWRIYLGNKIVEHHLKRFLKIKTPSKKIIISPPEYIFKSTLA